MTGSAAVVAVMVNTIFYLTANSFNFVHRFHTPFNAIFANEIRFILLLILLKGLNTMSLFAIADTHLSFGTDKPMDTFEGWENYTERLKKNWNNVVSPNDDVVIAGDISWAMDFSELAADFDFLESLNGNKILLKGNHDYWWNTLSKMNRFLEENHYRSIRYLYNNAYTCGTCSVCGSRGWIYDSEEEQDQRILLRETARIKRSIECAETENIVLFLHYPPVSQNIQCKEITDLIKEYGIKKCYFGHLHGEAAKYAFEGSLNGVDYKLISCDRLKFTPYLILKY